MKQVSYFVMAFALIAGLAACGPKKEQTGENDKDSTDKFEFLSEKFSDLKILRYQIPGFDDLSLKQKELVYYLSQAALCGRDIIFDQNYKHNLYIRRTLENIYETYDGERSGEDWDAFMNYTKRVWFSNGIHHHYSEEKFIPEFSEDYFAQLINGSDQAGFPLQEGQTVEQMIEFLSPVMFDPTVDNIRVGQNSEKDLIVQSSTNFYEGVNQKEVEDFYEAMKVPGDETPISYGLNSKLIKKEGKVVEQIYKVGGMYSPAIEKIVFWLEKAAGVAENEHQEKTIRELITFYQTGDLQDFDDFNILWVQDTTSVVDFVCCFTETYGDPMGMKATWEAVIDFKDIEGTKRSSIISKNAQWFEDNSPVDKRFKKETVKGVSAKVITVAQLGGDCYPSTPIGINLPNANWIRAMHGSKSVTIDNITYAYDMASHGNGFLNEFAYSEEEIKRAEEHGYLAGKLHTDLHECLGHGSGKLLPGVSKDALKNYGSPIEEVRADLFALYYIMDQKMIDLGLLPSLEAAKAEYDGYIRNGMMTQLTRIEPGKTVTQAHMRCRQLIAKWAFEKGKDENVIELVKKDDKTYVVVNDHDKLRQIFGEMLAEVQRITSEGDYNAAKELVETYAVQVDPVLHKEVLDRYAILNLAPYGGFINPVLLPVEEDGKIIDIKVEYPNNYVEQMMEYGKNYSYLPTYN